MTEATEIHVAADAATAGNQRVVVMGAGPAGLTAAWELTNHGVAVSVLEADPHIVGGIARTAEYKGFRFDIGGHRFFTKADEIRETWHRILDPEDWLSVPRMSRIYYRGKFFAYPLKALDALSKLGVVTAAACLGSFARAKISPREPEHSFEDWVINRFGERLYRIFFKTYTEKVWGMECSEISADWAAQRIKGLSLLEAVRNSLPSPSRKGNGEVIKTLIDTFEYPKYGPGMMWERAAEQVAARGGTVTMGARVVGVSHENGVVTGVSVERDGAVSTERGDEYVSTLPLRELVGILDPAPPSHVLAASRRLRYRDYLTVVLVADRAEVFPDNWIYVHDPTVNLGRVQNYKNWSPHMVPDPSQTALGLEYFCSEGDDLWGRPDDDLLALGRRELADIGLVPPESIVDGTVVRMPKAYPVYDERYRENVAVVREWLENNVKNLQTVGRNGMHKYNNQDHSMLTALLAARNILGQQWDPWRVNTDAEYHESADPGADRAGRMIPRRVNAGG